MGGCVSHHKRQQKIKEKNQCSKSRKGWGKTVSPVPGAPLTKEKINGSRYSSAETTINNLVHQGSDMSIIANGKPEVASVNFHVTEIQRGRPKSISYGSKDEAYFDSVACWESDCDEDFLSVNGDFLPSAGNTMSLPNSGQVTPRPSIASLKDRMMLIDNKDQVALMENKDQVALVENKDGMIPAENKDRILPVENNDRMLSVEKKKKLKEFFLEKLSCEDITAGVDSITSSEPQLNLGAAAEDDGNGATVVKCEGSKGSGRYPDTIKDAVVNNEGANEHDLHEKQMMKCCLPRLMPNGTVNGKRRSPCPNHISKENKQH